MEVNLMKGNNLELLKQLEDNSVDSVVTDPPYGLSFMNKKWDYDVPSTEFWTEVYRVLKPGGHVLSFGGTRTYHRMVVNMEDAGFEIRDQIMWLYGSGFPKSHNIGKAVDKLQGNEREVVGEKLTDMARHKTTNTTKNEKFNGGQMMIEDTKGTSEWEGWGTALKPANEPICVARKPLSEKTIAENVLKWGTGGINIDGCRVGTISETDKNNWTSTRKKQPENTGWSFRGDNGGLELNTQGRWPANIILDEEAGRVLDEQSGISKSSKGRNDNGSSVYGGNSLLKSSTKMNNPDRGFTDKGGASRFFYCPKVSKKERNAGCEDLEEKKKEFVTTTSTNKETADKFGCERKGTVKNTHPTVKPIDLMAYLCRLVTPPNGTVLDPFMGSGSTGIASQLEGFNFIGMEMDDNYFEIASKRINKWMEFK